MLAGHAHALLRVDGAAVGTLVGAEEHVLELDHARIGEEKRGIPARDERHGRHNRVPVLDKEVEESLADFVAGQFFGHSHSRKMNFGIIPSGIRCSMQITKVPNLWVRDSNLLVKSHAAAGSKSSPGIRAAARANAAAKRLWFMRGIIPLQVSLRGATIAQHAFRQAIYSFSGALNDGGTASLRRATYAHLRFAMTLSHL